MFDIIKAIILGIVEGITEWLPISSTGHLILVEQFIGEVIAPGFNEMFNVVIQLGAIMAVVVLFFNKLNPFSRLKCDEEKKQTYQLWLKVIVACLPAAVFGLLLDDWLDEHLYNFVVVGLMLIIYGVLFIIVENLNKNKIAKTSELSALSYKTALIIGAFQVLSLIPGTSRSGATILGAILVGCSRFVAAEFTFFLAIPVMFGASLLKIAKYFLDAEASFGALEIGTLSVGMIVSFVISILAIKFLLDYIKKNDFKAFGWYRIVLGLVVILYWIIAL